MSSSGPELARHQTEVLTEMGAHLRDRRQEAQLTLEQISTDTRIPLRLLTAIESGNLTALPEAVYTQGLLRRFADAVGLNGREYSEKFPTGIDPTPRFSGWRKTPAAQLRPFHLYIAYIVLVIAAVTGISLSLDRMQKPSVELVNGETEVTPTSPSPSPQPTTAPASPTPKATKKPAAAATPASTTAAKPDETKKVNDTKKPTSPEAQKKKGPVSIELTVTSESWLQVLADGEVAFEGTLSEGKQAWSANREITVVAGNAGAIMVTVNGGDEKAPLGAPGAVEEVTFMADSRPNAAAASNSPASGANTANP
jgi:cytoskeletal protein RodZ